MKLCDVNPFMRYAELQPSVMTASSLSCAYDYRIFYIIEGTARLILKDGAINLSSGSLLYIRPGTPYYFDGKVKVIVLNFDMTRNQTDRKKAVPPAKYNEVFDEGAIFENDPPIELESVIAIQKAFEIQSKIQKCLLHYCYPTPFSDSFTSAIIKDILCYIAQSYYKEENEVPELARRVALYIQQNYDRELTNSLIANELGYHSFYLNRIFKKSMGVTIHQAVILERVRIAKQLLKMTDLSINSIAVESGFCDRSQFCTTFRKYEGCTPMQYREK